MLQRRRRPPPTPPPIPGSCRAHLAFLLLISILLFTGEGEAGQPGPDFVGQIENVTVTARKDAVLTCTVEHLRGYKVAWVQVETQTILTIHTSVITRNPRVGLSHEGHSVFRLHLKNVTEADRGYYMCQINTDPMINQMGFLQVVVPPDIDDTAWMSDLVVREGNNVSLECRARGYPPPKVIWKKEDKHDRSGSVKVFEGSVLSIPKVSRLDMAAYLCVAANGIHPSVSKRIQLRVQFPPVLWIPNQLEGARIGTTALLECNTEAFPHSINYWTNHKGEMVAAGGTKYGTTSREESYKTYMRLAVHNLTREDFSTYRCIAKNSLGETDGAIKLYEIEPTSSGDGSTQGSLMRADSDDEARTEGTPGHPHESFENNFATTRTRGKQPTSKKPMKGPTSWRGDAVNELSKGEEIVYREKERSHVKDIHPNRDSGLSYNHSFSSDAGYCSPAAPSLYISCLVFFLTVAREL